jgi:hypothetical protein
MTLAKFERNRNEFIFERGWPRALEIYIVVSRHEMGCRWRVK